MEPPRYFRSYKEISTREAFDPECEITPENFAGLVGPYHFADEDEVSCQVRCANQRKRCNEGHKRGWLGRTKDGKEALIGRVCGRKHFKANAAFVADRRRINSGLNITRHLQRLEATRGSQEFAATLKNALEHLKVIRAEVESWQDRLPASIVTRLRNMAKSGIGAVRVQFKYVDEDEKGNPKPEWVPNQIEPISGFIIWDQQRIRSLFKALHEIRHAFDDAVLDRCAGERRLRAWADKLSELPPRAREVAELKSGLGSFSAPDNVRRLCFIVRNQNDGIAVARIAVEQERGRAAATMEAARRLYNELRARISARANGREFRVDDY